MASLVESTGALMASLFVPANVVTAQRDNQTMLQERADKLNGTPNNTIQRATRTGEMTDGAARQSLQSMNSSLFLSGNRDRELGEATVQIVKDSAAQAPAVFADTVKGGLNLAGGTIWRAIPWWIWLAIGLYAAMQLAVLVKALRQN